MIRKTALALLALAASLAVPSGASAGTLAHPIFTRADVGLAGSWTGYRATIYVAPLTYAIWPGGFLSDGTFVQSGLSWNGNTLNAFVWATNDATTCTPGDCGQVPLRDVPITPTAGTWITFEMAWLYHRWTFRYHDAGGWHFQGSFRSDAKLASFQVVNEYWATAVHPFATQIVKDVQVRTGSSWGIPGQMSTSSTDEQCGHDAVTSPYRGKLVFRSIEVPCRGYADLW